MRIKKKSVNNFSCISFSWFLLMYFAVKSVFILTNYQIIALTNILQRKYFFSIVNLSYMHIFSDPLFIHPNIYLKSINKYSTYLIHSMLGLWYTRINITYHIKIIKLHASMDIHTPTTYPLPRLPTLPTVALFINPPQWYLQKVNNDKSMYPIAFSYMWRTNKIVNWHQFTCFLEENWQKALLQDFSCSHFLSKKL